MLPRSAMGTQKEIAQEIINQGGDYILSLKGNQGKIHQDVQQLFDWGFKTQFKDIPHEAYKTINKGHGRIEIRRHWLLSSVEYLIDAQLWSGLKRVGLIESERRIKGQLPTIERRYYLLSLDSGVERFATAVRSHWGIEREGRCFASSLSNHAVENQCSAFAQIVVRRLVRLTPHAWCLDVAFNEDDSRIRSGHASENMALIRHIASQRDLVGFQQRATGEVALNLLSKETSFKAGKKAKRLKAGWNNDYLAKVLAA